ncbi:MAG: hypothetical protein RLZZ44_445 [Bacteroidota bacterium]
MARCIEIAKNGFGTTYPNPMVGSLIVHNDQIIGEGWHRKAGEPHAEVNAIHSVKDPSLLDTATIYVSLEPCSHFGKTPPCCDLIIKSRIPNVIVGTVDSNSKVAGNGIKRLKEAGVNVIVGILEKKCYDLNRRFFTFHEKKRPYIFLKWAQTHDGFIAPLEKKEQKPVWITNTISRQLVHKWRTEEQAILIGTQTVIDDNPQLNARDWEGNNPIRIVIDQHNRIPKTARVFDNKTKTIVFSNQKSIQSSETINIEVIDFQQNIAPQIIKKLYEHQIQSVIIEGGAQTLQTFIDTNLWDEALIFLGNNAFDNGIKAPVLNTVLAKKEKIGTDELLTIRNYD